MVSISASGPLVSALYCLERLTELLMPFFDKDDLFKIDRDGVFALIPGLAGVTSLRLDIPAPRPVLLILDKDDSYLCDTPAFILRPALCKLLVKPVVLGRLLAMNGEAWALPI